MNKLLFVFGRRIVGKYKMMRVMHHLRNQMTPFIYWNGPMCPANQQRRDALFAAAEIVIKAWEQI
jgi:hypothetical protein